MTGGGGVDIELIDLYKGSSNPRVFVPAVLKINGEEVLMPQGAEVVLHPISDESAATATITVFVSSFTMRTELHPDSITSEDLRSFAKRTA